MTSDWSVDTEVFLLDVTQSNPILTYLMFNIQFNGAGFWINGRGFENQVKLLRVTKKTSQQIKTPFFSLFIDWYSRGRTGNDAIITQTHATCIVINARPRLWQPDIKLQGIHVSESECFTFSVERIEARFAHIFYSSSPLIRAEEHQGAAPVLHVAGALAPLIAPEPFDGVGFSIFTSAEAEWWARQRWWKGLWSRCHFHWGHHKGLGHEKTP